MNEHLALLKDRFGFEGFRPGQAQAIEAILRDGAALAVFPTGGGKSLCYQLPALVVEGVTVVVSPLLALMKDQIDFLTRRGIPAARLDSTMSADEAREVSARMRSGELKLLYVAPERFNNERFLAELGRTEIGLFAVDEAHCISEWGHNFRPDYLKLAETARTLGAKRVLALTATATPAVVRDVCAAFGIPETGVALTGFYRPNLNLIVTPCTPQERISKLIERVRKRPAGTTIVYVTLQKTAEQVAARLAAEGLSARAYHAGMEPEERTATQDWWMADPSAIVVATIAFGMGIDKADVRYVYHFNLPKSLESFSQEIGRAGRDGQLSTVETLACACDLPTLANFAYGDTPEPASLRALVAELLGGPEVIDVAPRDLGDRHDLRPLVLRTALTYLELAGALRKGTPFYAGYEFRPLNGIEAVLGAFSGEPGEFVAAIVRAAKKGTKWYGVDPDAVAAKLASERKRVVRALDVLAERGLIELRASDLRDRYHRLVEPERAHELATELAHKFETRERGEQERLARVPALLQASECLSNALVRYFGEERTEPCGHCSLCRTGRAAIMPPCPPATPLDEVVPLGELNALADIHPQALGTPRQRARFLCGLSGPSLSKARLTRNRLFGAAEEHPFEEVLSFVT
jgi:ATP-dependent DNA helicase RecQ